MKDKSIGSARIEPTEDTVARLYIERLGDDPTVLYLEPGNGISILEDGPVKIEAFAMDEDA